MLQYERFEAIMNTLQQQSSVRVKDLAPELGVSDATIRRDIAALDKAGRLRRVFGGAVAIPQAASAPAPDVAVSIKNNLLPEEKQRIAAYAAALVQDGDLVFIDAGTTTGAMIDFLTNTKATYVTNGIKHAYQLAVRGMTVYTTAGHVKPSTESIVGHDTVENIRKYNFTKCFIGATAIDTAHGLTTYDIDESLVKAAAVENAARVFVLVDHTKFGKVGPVSFASPDCGLILTDKDPGKQYRELAIMVV
ncbi:MAG: DeoR/GlpR family DNA-binding transcription regulator [Clostridiales bacterium]|nr:DeoR/GlpR family DNA-binding transcription regulator [Clostridiales bacterium]